MPVEMKIAFHLLLKHISLMMDKIRQIHRLRFLFFVCKVKYYSGENLCRYIESHMRERILKFGLKESQKVFNTARVS